MTVSSQVKQTLATLEGIEATLRVYSTQTQEQETKAVFDQAVTAAGEIISDLQARIRVLETEERQYKGF